MDSAVSWRRAISATKLQYPKADQFTTIYLAKELYLANFRASEAASTNSKIKNPITQQMEKRLILQGA